MKKIVFSILLTIGLASCSSALDREYHVETLNEDLEVLVARDKMNEEDLQKFSLYLVNSEMNGVNLEGKTYREILNAAKEQK